VDRRLETGDVAVMRPIAISREGRSAFVIATCAVVAVAVFAVIQAVSTAKVGLYVDNVERSGLLYALPALALAGLVVLLKAPRLSLYLMVFLIPFNTIGGTWGDTGLVTLGKLSINFALVAGVFSSFLVERQYRVWLTGTRLGHALMAWLVVIAVSIAVGFLSTPRRGDWLRESSWMILFVGAVAAGTPLRDRKDVGRLLLAGGAGVAVMQVIAFWMLATGQRYDRADIEGGEGFFRAPFAPFCVFYLLLVQAMFFFGAATRNALTRRQKIALFAGVAILSAGLLATMGRSLWISAIVGTVVILFLAPWRASLVRAVAFAVAGIAAAVGMVVLVDSLSPGSRGNWTRLAVDFFFQLGQKGSATTLGREVEWLHAIDLWKLSPIVGYGLGYPFPDNPYNLAPADPFYMHNSFFNVLAKSGALGLIALLWLLWESCRSLLRSYLAAADLTERVLAVALLAGVVQMAVLSLFSPALTTTDSVLSMAVLIGLAAALHRLMQRRAASA
jgi:O-antigen ligase